MAGFIFGGDTGIKNPQELAAKRAIANALLAAQRAPRNVGEGLNALGDGIVAGVLNARGDKAEAAGIESANSAFAPILAALGGGGAFPARPSAPDAMNAPVGAVERAPLPPVEDYASKRVAQAFGDKKAPATGADPIQEVMDAGGAAKNDNWLRYANQGATRNLPIDAKLQSALSFLPELGVQIEVFSGGQPGKGSGLPRVGSTRHDHGGAADVFFYKDGRKLDWANPQDVPIFQEIVRRSKAAGVTGFGAGDGYMQPGSMHIGFGAPAVWGAGGKGENAPDWLRIAYDGVTPPSNAGVQVAQALSAPAQGREPMSGQSDMPGLGTLIGAMSNPWMNENQGAIVKALLGQRMKEMDPATALERRKLEAEIKALENPQAKPTDDMREYEFARSQGYQGTFQNWQIDNKRAGATNVNVGAEKGYDKTVGEGYGKRFLDIQTDAQAAQRALNALDVMDQAMADPGFYSGTGGQYVTTLKRAASALGMDAEGISSIETFNAMAKQAALDSMGGSLGTGFSNADRDFVLDQVPNLANTPEGNKQLIDVQRKLNQRKQQIAQFARDYAAQNNGRIDAGFDDALSKWADANQLFPAPPKTDGKGPRKIMSEEEYMGLPSGAEFVAPDGSIRRKP